MRTLTVWVAVAAAGAALPAAAQGRLLYANDDDWDWASPSNARAKSVLADQYGEMDWPGLDWAVEGLKRPVRGVAVGMLPTSPRLHAAELSKLRSERWTEAEEGPGAIATALRARQRPQVLVLMSDAAFGAPVALDDADRKALLGFLRAGGRVVVLDDGARFGPVLQALIEHDPVSAFAQAGAPAARSAPPPGGPGSGPPPRDPLLYDPDRLPVADPVGPPQSAAPAHGIPNAVIEGLVERVAPVGTAEWRVIVRDGSHTPGRALLVQWKKPAGKAR